MPSTRPLWILLTQKPQDDDSSLASKVQTALSRLDAITTSVRDEEQPTTSTDPLPATAAEDSDPAQLISFYDSEKFYEMSEESEVANDKLSFCAV